MNEKSWLTVKEGSQLCYEMGLPRSTKSLRRWCSKDEVSAQKRQTSHGEKWFIERASLEIKVNEELEFLKQSETENTYLDQPAGHGSDMSGHDRTQVDVSAHEWARPDASGHERSQGDISESPKTRDLEDQILLLTNDVKWRDRVLKDQKNANDTLLDEVKGQSRYIGHLETKLMRLGENPDLTFLEAPTPISKREESKSAVEPEIVQPQRQQPNQQSFQRGRMG